ncbi:MAG: right-handed parallel beta-helix repeat-containing protein [Deltaproteobacteria bacterium]|nr:right-handed parallel beta-helix repeat-containing protein [Deltaproteobacteria bacterium]
MRRYLIVVLVGAALACCGGVKSDERDADAGDALEMDGTSDLPGEDVPAEGPSDPVSEDAAGEDGTGECEGGPPETFVDGFAWVRDLHVGPGQDHATVSAAAAVAGPGDRIVVHSGDYDGEYVSGLQGTESQPIGIVGAAGESAPVFRDSVNGLQLSNARWVLIEGIVVDSCTGNGINLDDGGDYATPAGPIVVRGVTIRDIGPTGNHDGLKMSGVDDFVIYGNTFERWGDGGSGVDMVGCHDGLIAGNTFTHTSDTIGANGVQAKGGCRNVEVRGNLFTHAGSRGVNMGGSTGDEFFRPLGIGYEASDIVVIANVFVGTQAPAAFVGCEDACLFAHNTVYRPARWTLRILNERPDLVTETRGGRVMFNIFVVDSALGTFVNIGPDTDPGSFTFDGNLWFDLDDPTFTMDTVPNDAGATLTQTNAIVQDDPLFGGAGSGDFTLQAGSPAVAQAGSLAERGLDYEEKCYEAPASLGAIEQ